MNSERWPSFVMTNDSYLGIQLCQRNSLIGIRVNLCITTKRFRNSLIFVGQNAGKRFEKIRRQNCTLLLRQGERKFLYLNYRRHVRSIHLGETLEQHFRFENDVERKMASTRKRVTKRERMMADEESSDLVESASQALAMVHPSSNNPSKELVTLEPA